MIHSESSQDAILSNSKPSTTVPVEVEAEELPQSRQWQQERDDPSLEKLQSARRRRNHQQQHHSNKTTTSQDNSSSMPPLLSVVVATTDQREEGEDHTTTTAAITTTAATAAITTTTTTNTHHHNNNFKTGDHHRGFIKNLHNHHHGGNIVEDHDTSTTLAPASSTETTQSSSSLPPSAALHWDPSPLLLVAARTGNFEMMRQLLKFGADPNAVHQNTTALEEATRAGHTDVAHFLVQHHGATVRADAVTMDPTAWALMVSHAVQAARDGNVPELRRLLDYGLPVRTIDPTTEDVLWHEEIVQVLIDYGLQISATQFPRVFHTVSLTILELLLRHGVVRADAKDTSSRQRTPLHAAASQGSLPHIDLLLEHGADLAVRDRTGKTPLDLAVEAGHTDAVAHLMRLALEGSIDADSLVQSLRRACLEGNVARARHLVEQKHVSANSISLEPGKDGTATAILRHPGIVQLLVQHKVAGASQALPRACQMGAWQSVLYLIESDAVTDVDATNDDGETALHLLASAGHSELVQLLLDRGVTVDFRDAHGATALNRAFLNGHLRVVQCILEHTRRPDQVQPASGMYPLHHAVLEQDRALCQSLLRMGADVDCPTKARGETPLHLVCGNDNPFHVDLVEELLAYGADMTVRDQRGFTPLDVACQSESLSCIFLLLQDGIYHRRLRLAGTEDFDDKPTEAAVAPVPVPSPPNPVPLAEQAHLPSFQSQASSGFHAYRMDSGLQVKPKSSLAVVEQLSDDPAEEPIAEAHEDTSDDDVDQEEDELLLLPTPPSEDKIAELLASNSMGDSVDEKIVEVLSQYDPQRAPRERHISPAIKMMRPPQVQAAISQMTQISQQSAELSMSFMKALKVDPVPQQGAEKDFGLEFCAPPVSKRPQRNAAEVMAATSLKKDLKQMNGNISHKIHPSPTSTSESIANGVIEGRILSSYPVAAPLGTILSNDHPDAPPSASMSDDELDSVIEVPASPPPLYDLGANMTSDSIVMTKCLDDLINMTLPTPDNVPRAGNASSSSSSSSNEDDNDDSGVVIGTRFLTSAVTSTLLPETPPRADLLAAAKRKTSPTTPLTVASSAPTTPVNVATHEVEAATSQDNIMTAALDDAPIEKTNSDHPLAAACSHDVKQAPSDFAPTVDAPMEPAMSDPPVVALSASSSTEDDDDDESDNAEIIRTSSSYVSVVDDADEEAITVTLVCGAYMNSIVETISPPGSDNEEEAKRPPPTDGTASVLNELSDSSQRSVGHESDASPVSAAWQQTVMAAEEAWNKTTSAANKTWTPGSDNEEEAKRPPPTSSDNEEEAKRPPPTGDNVSNELLDADQRSVGNESDASPVSAAWQQTVMAAEEAWNKTTANKTWTPGSDIAVEQPCGEARMSPWSAGSVGQFDDDDAPSSPVSMVWKQTVTVAEEAWKQTASTLAQQQTQAQLVAWQQQTSTVLQNTSTALQHGAEQALKQTSTVAEQASTVAEQALKQTSTVAKQVYQRAVAEPCVAASEPCPADNLTCPALPNDAVDPSIVPPTAASPLPSNDTHTTSPSRAASPLRSGDNHNTLRDIESLLDVLRQSRSEVTGVSTMKDDDDDDGVHGGGLASVLHETQDDEIAALLAGIMQREYKPEEQLSF